MREFSKISPQLWRSRRFRSLSIQERYVFLYLMTNPHLTRVGCYYLDRGYAGADLSLEMTDYLSLMQRLEGADLIMFDTSTSEVLVLNWFKFNPPTSRTHHIGAKREIALVKSQQLRDICSEAMENEYRAQVAQQQAGNDERERKTHAALGLMARAIEKADGKLRR